MKKRVVSIIKYVLFLGLSILLLYYALKDISFEQFIIELGRTNYSWLILSMMVAILSHLLRAYRWKILMEPLGYKPSLANTFASVMIGYFANLAFPRAGEVSRCAMLKKTDNIPVDSSFGTVITERIFDLFVLITLILINLAVEKELKSFLWTEFGDKLSPLLENSTLIIILAVLGVAALILIYVLRNKIKEISMVKKVMGILSGLLDGLLSFRKIRRKPQFVVSTILTWFCYWLLIHVAKYSYPETVDFGIVETFTLLIVGGMAMSAPVQGGIGAYHLLVGNLLVIYGLSHDSGITFATILHSSQMLMMIVVGSISLIFVLIKESNLKKITDANG